MRTLDPRAKLIAALCLMALVIARGDWLRLGLIALAVCLLIAANGLVREWLALLRGLAWIVALTIALTWLALDGELALLTALRFVTLVAVWFVFFQSTRPEDLGNSLVQWRVPYPFAFVLTGGMQFVPVLARRAEAVRDAQRARGLATHWYEYHTLLVPLLIQSFKLADELAEAMEARGFGSPQRSFLREYRWRARDVALVAGSVIVLMAGLAV